MDAILNWMKGILLLFLIGHVLLYLVQNKTYEKYVHFFVRILILLAVIAPVATKVMDEDVFIQKIEQAQFFQELKNVQRVSEMSSEDGEYYHSQYEEICGKQVEEEVKQQGYDVAYSKVTLNDVYEIESIAIGVGSQSNENPGVGNPGVESQNSRNQSSENQSLVSKIEIARIETGTGLQTETESEKETMQAKYEALENFLCENYRIDQSQVKIEEVR